MTWTDVTTTLPRKPRQARADEPGRRSIHIWCEGMTEDGDWRMVLVPMSAVDVALIADLAATGGIGDAATANGAVALATEVCERHGWLLANQWTDERGELHTRLEKEER